MTDKEKAKKKIAIGARIDVDLISLLKIDAIATGMTFEDYINEALWSHADKKNLKSKAPNQNKLDKNLN